MASIRIKGPAGSYSEIELKDGCTIGRTPECGIQLREPHASRKHAALNRRDDGWHLRDLETRNGTLVNGARIKEHHLSPGDIITIGKTVLTFMDGSAPEGSREDQTKAAGQLEKIGEYEVVSEVARSSHARICEVRREGVARQMVMKVFEREAFGEGIEKMFDTLQALAKVFHPAIASIYEVNPTGARPYFVSEYIRGQSLAEMLAAQGKLPVDRAKNIILRIADALQAAHARGILHCNLKPRNVMFGIAGEVKLVDFGGICKVGPPGASRLASFDAIPCYVAPEQILREPVDQRTDIYSLGCLFYTLVSGLPPFGGANGEEVKQRHLAERPPDLAGRVPDLPPSLNGVIQRMMAREPGLRFQSMQEVIAALTSPLPQIFAEAEAQAAPRNAAAARPGGQFAAFLGGALVVLMLVALFLGARDLGQAAKEGISHAQAALASLFGRK